MPDLPLTGLRLWVATDRLTLADGAGVASWPDQSGNGSNLVQASAALQPVYRAKQLSGRGVMHFHRAHYMTGPAAALGGLDRLTSFTVCVVLRHSPRKGGLLDGCLLSNQPDSQSYVQGFSLFVINGIWVQALVGNSVVNRLETFWSPPLDNVWTIMTVQYDGSGQNTGVKVWFNSVPQKVTPLSNQLTTSTLSSNPITLGAVADGTIGLLGDIAELALWSPMLDNTGRLSAETYLAQRWWAQIGLIPSRRMILVN